ncbi:MAG TPA: hypothetical protein VG204_19215 [Terriglobia bacterium]|nr:hypothetical protein [Terriglobia bacterium]
MLDSILWSRGKHNVRFGGELRRVQINTSFDPDARGTLDFTGYSTSDFTTEGRPVAGTGLDFADFLLGLPQVTSERFGIRSNYLRSWVYTGFVQDDWLATSRLTFNFGLRYEYFPRFTEKYGHLSDYPRPGHFAPQRPERGRGNLFADLAPVTSLFLKRQVLALWPPGFAGRCEPASPAGLLGWQTSQVREHWRDLEGHLFTRRKQRRWLGLH